MTSGNWLVELNMECTPMTRLLRLFLLLALAGLLAIPAPARASQSYTVIDDHHTAITFTSTPRRIISLAPNVTEILFTLGVGSEVVGASSYSDYPAAAKKIPVVYTYSGASYEKIVALK